MASFTLSPSTPPKLYSSQNRVFAPAKPLMAMSARSGTAGFERGMKLTCQAANIPAGDVPAMERRKLMNLLLFAAVGLPAAGILAPYSASFLQTRGGTIAKDEDGNSITASEWLKTHGPGDKTLTQGLKEDPTYLIVETNKAIATYGINAVCTHLGCIVPWNTVEKKFICPCHGSRYNNEGTVIKGPASRSLELAKVSIEDDKVVFAPWTEADFRTAGVGAPWWS